MYDTEAYRRFIIYFHFHFFSMINRIYIFGGFNNVFHGQPVRERFIRFFLNTYNTYIYYTRDIFAYLRDEQQIIIKQNPC